MTQLTPTADRKTEAEDFFEQQPLPALLLSATHHVVLKASGEAHKLLPFLESSSGPICNFVLPLSEQPLSQWLHRGCPEAITVHWPGQSILSTRLHGRVLSDNRLYIQLIDVSAQAQKDAYHFMLAGMVEQTSDCITAADADYKPITWNPAAERIFGISAQDAIGGELRQFVDIEYDVPREEVRQLINLHGEWRGEMRFRRKSDGQQVALLATFKKLVCPLTNNVVHVITCTDITETKLAAQKIAETENRLQVIADLAPIGLWMTDVEDKVSFISRPLLEFSNLGHLKLEEIDWTTLIHPDDKEATISKNTKAKESRKNFSLTYRLKKGDGWRWVQDTATPHMMPDGSFAGYIGSVIDIDDRRAQAERLHYQATILENVQDIVLTTDVEFRLKTYNKIAYKYYGTGLRHGIDKSIIELVAFKYSDTSPEEALQTLLATGRWEGEVYMDQPDGQRMYLHQTVSQMRDGQGTHIGYIAVGRDVTDRHEAEKKLQDSEVFYRSLIADSLDGILLVNAEGIISFVAPAIKNILGFLPEEGIGQNLFSFVHPDDFSFARQTFQSELENNATVKFIEIRLRTKAGEWLWCTVRGHNLLHHPAVQAMRIYIHNSSSRRQAEQALIESEQRFRNLIADLDMGVVMQDPKGVIILCNRAAHCLLDLTEDQLMGRTSFHSEWNIVHEDGSNFPGETHPVPVAIQTKRPVRHVVMGVYRPTKKDRVWILVNAAPVLKEDGEVQHVVCSFTDITEQRRLQQKMLRKEVARQRLITQATIDGQEKERLDIGKELHDNIGQQLTTTKLFLDFLRNTATAEQAPILEKAIRAQMKVIDEVRSMSRSLIPPALGDLGLVEAVKDLVDSFTCAQPVRIKMEYRSFNEAVLPKNGNLMLFRIVQEQLNNIAKHAGASEVQILFRQTDSNTMLLVQDNGCGFDLLQTKKGLGLSNIRNRVELFNGELELHTAPGKGCTLQLLIPHGGAV